MRKFSLFGAAAILALPVIVEAQGASVFIEARGGAAVPTGNAADVAKIGPMVGATLGVQATPLVSVFADVDLGFHSGKNGAPDINVFHYMGKIGFNVVRPTEGSKFNLVLNAGAGLMQFKPDGFDSSTDFAINVGAEAGYAASDRVYVFVKPQGDIAFTDGDQAWIWPVSAGFRVNFR